MDLPTPITTFKRYARSTALSSSIVVFLIVLFVTQFYLRNPYVWFPGVGDINFAIHEFGHIMTMGLDVPFIVNSAAGTFLQLLFPIVVTSYMFYRKRYIETAFFFAWLGTNLQYVGIYMKDMVLRTMPMSQLFGPEAIHDWEYIFRWLRVDRYALEIGNVVLFIGNSMMVVASIFLFVLIVYQLFLKFGSKEKEKEFKRVKTSRYRR